MSSSSSPSEPPKTLGVLIQVASDDELRAEVRRRGMEMHSKEFSEAAQAVLREIPKIRKRLDELEKGMQR